jgi:cytochrome c biogenesis protein CcmG/thiol:disulfide interchange protein DsbE
MNESASVPSKTDKFSTILGVIIVLLLVAIGVFVLRPGPPRGEGKPLSALELEPLTGPGQPVSLNSLGGKVTIVNFFATWCGPCRAELPHLAELRNEFAGNERFVVLPVSAGEGSYQKLREETEILLRSLNIDLPTYVDPGGVTRNSFSKIADFRGFPTSFIMDGNGVVRKIWVGYDPNVIVEMHEMIEQLLEE